MTYTSSFSARKRKHNSEQQIGTAQRRNKIQMKPTTGSLPSLSTLSVVPATLAPFLLKSYSMSRLLSCGNMAASCSMRSAGIRRAEDGVGAVEAEEVKKK